jgi:hypothetical protein
MANTSASTNLAREIALAVSRLGAVLWRNNSGTAWMGESIRASRPTAVVMQPGDVLVRAARRVDFGVGDGGSDQVGFTPFPVAGGLVLPVWTEVEEKTGSGRLRPNQRTHLAGVARHGGLAIVARTVEDALAPVRRAVAGDASVLGVVHGLNRPTRSESCESRR